MKSKIAPMEAAKSEAIEDMKSKGVEWGFGFAESIVGRITCSVIDARGGNSLSKHFRFSWKLDGKRVSADALHGKLIAS